MMLTARIDGEDFRVRLDAPIDLSIPLDFHGAQPNAYDVPEATSRPFSGGGFVGDTRQGGSCNFETTTLTAHCNGTHTECIGHLTDERISIVRTLADCLVPATLITVASTPAVEAQTGDRYPVPLDPNDRLITAAALGSALEGARPAFLDALVVRTLPNDPGKSTRRYAEEPAPFFSEDAMRVIAALPVRHLLVDLPSLDRARDEGRLAAHRLYWRLGSDDRGPTAESAVLRTVTELVFVPDAVADGPYLLNLQIAPFVLDAAPSRPLLFALAESA
jgi:hypothetical protein